ncbi:hypothetical protein HAX54_026433 [Datura stramonium]|uniref:Uncharacterized protein n=1 Tax=Datura stramonium TaxID=4076 RepID=A0ABS8V410_DATST|nr:hypothetical protein [Datura stramonium]
MPASSNVDVVNKYDEHCPPLIINVISEYDERRLLRYSTLLMNVMNIGLLCDERRPPPTFDIVNEYDDCRPPPVFDVVNECDERRPPPVFDVVNSYDERQPPSIFDVVNTYDERRSPLMSSFACAVGALLFSGDNIVLLDASLVKKEFYASLFDSSSAYLPPGNTKLTDK